MMKRSLIAIFLFTSLVWSCTSSDKGESEQSAIVYGVRGELAAEALGITLTHEHIMSRFGLDPMYIGSYPEDTLKAQVLPYLKQLKALGVNTIFDCTTAYFGRNVALLKEISDETGVEIVTNTGYYAGASDRYVPESAYASSIEEIAELWTGEFERGIDGTGIRPGFIKLAFDNGVSDIDVKLFKAGLLTHKATGLTMVVHTEENLEAAEKQLQLLEEFGVSPEAWVWVHASRVEDTDLLLETARKGAWISLDKFKAPDAEAYVNRLQKFKDQKLLNKVLLSHDGNSFSSSGALREYSAILTHLVPALKEHGFSEEEVHQLLVRNPASAFGIGVRSSATL